MDVWLNDIPRSRNDDSKPTCVEQHSKNFTHFLSISRISIYDLCIEAMRALETYNTCTTLLEVNEATYLDLYLHSSTSIHQLHFNAIIHVGYCTYVVRKYNIIEKIGLIIDRF